MRRGPRASRELRGALRDATAVLILGLVTSACGYALVGKGITTDPSVKRIGVPLFKDRTGKPGLDQRITHAVIEELLKRGRFQVVQTAEDVDAIVDGELLSYTVAPVGFQGAGNTQTQPSTYRISLVARARYAKTGADQPIWANDNFSYSDEYDLGSSENYFDREDEALERLTTAFSRQLVSSMLEAF